MKKQVACSGKTENTLSHSQYCHADTALGDVRSRNHVMDIRDVTLPEPPRECYVGMFRFGPEYYQHWQETDSVRNCPNLPYYCDYLWFDIDNEDLEMARKHAMDLLTCLENVYNVRPAHCQVCFSGSKGYHIGIPAELFGAIPDSQNAQKFKTMARELAGDIPIDTTIYERNRLWRVLNSINAKSGLYKIPLTSDELVALDIEAQKKLAAAKREVPSNANQEFQPNEKLVALYKAASGGISSATSRKSEIKQAVVKEKACINKLLEGMKSGRRNEAAVRIADHYKKLEYDQDKALASFIEWNAKNDPPLEESELTRCLQSVYEGGYDYGCNDAMLVQYCDAQCPYYNEKRHVYPFSFTELGNPHPCTEALLLTDIDLMPAKNDIPTLKVQHSPERPQAFPTVANGAERVYILTDSPERWYDLAEILGEKTRIVSPGSLKTEALTLSDIQQKAQGYVDYRISRILASPEHAHLDELRKLLPYIGIVDAYHMPVYVDCIAKQFKLKKKTVEKMIQHCRTIQASNAAESEPEFTKSEIEQAEDLLSQPDLLNRFITATERLGCVGEDDNKLTIYLALTSRLLDDTINLIVKGESSGGKSFQVQTVSRFFPKNDVLEFTAITPKALYHRKDNLEHKGMIVYERPGAEESDYTIRTLQSEKKLVLSTVIKNPETNEHETTDIEINGPIAYIETTTQTHLHAENETRCFEIYIDESEEQTERIFSAQRSKYQGDKPVNDDFLRTWQALQRQLKPVKIKIPYVNLINFPTKPVRVRRDHERFLLLIMVSAFLHQRQRKQYRDDFGEYIEANVDDYALAHRLARRIMAQTIKAVTPSTEQLIAIAQVLQSQRGEDGTFTLQDLIEKLDWKRTKANRSLKDATNAGYIELVDSKRGTAYTYRFKRLPDANDEILLTPEQLADEIARQESDEVVHLSTPVQNGGDRLI